MRPSPFAHQSRIFDLSKDFRSYAYFLEQGCGKTRILLDTIAHLYLKKEIDAVVLVAPAGVETNFVNDQLPQHLPEEVLPAVRSHIYYSSKAKTNAAKAQRDALLAHPGLSVLAISYDAVITQDGRKYLWDFLRKRKCLYAADESRRIKNPAALRTKAIVKSAVYAPYRRILNGTPVANSPFDVYSQLLFLDENFWRNNGIGSYTSFKGQFGVFRRMTIASAGGMRQFDQLVAYKDIDLLKRLVDTISTRVTKADVLDLPPKLYSRRLFEMSSQQEYLYNKVRDEFIVELKAGVVSAPLAIVRLLRLQQIMSGYVPLDGSDPIYDIPGPNPRLELLAQITEDTPHSGIIWCRFNRTVDKVMAMLGDTAVRYDGMVATQDREAAKVAFQKGDKQWFVSKASCGGEGITLTAAQTVIYCENTYNLAERLQSEDRAHRIGQTKSVNYIDLICADTVDEKIVDALQKKNETACLVTGDVLKGWLSA